MFSCFFFLRRCTVLGSHLQIASVGPCCPCHASLFKVSSPLAKRTIIIWKSQRLPTLPENNIACEHRPSSEIHNPTFLLCREATLPKTIFIPQQLSLVVPLRLATGCRVDLVSSNKSPNAIMRASMSNDGAPKLLFPSPSHPKKSAKTVTLMFLLSYHGL